MDSRQLWEKHAVLAEAFCFSDDQVSAAQGTLDEAQAQRSRLLAAFAVTVGSDGAVADLLGLNEREVRVARRTVGRENAKRVAGDLLTAPPAPPAAQETVEVEPEADTLHSVNVPPPVHAAPMPPPPPPHAVPPVQAVPGYEPLGYEPLWTAAMDALLIRGWQTGLDLQVLAAELGIDLASLIARAQQLSYEGRLMAAAAPEDRPRSGRHRRNRHEDQSLGENVAYLPHQQSWPHTAQGYVS
ncbi:hypothetical protein [Wenjunlia tyrosinilytica]|uniref:Uncharacterized protein n=1 Tax=Wenjunlia tyrosinilytica TaxID=1544741 RepID=A0A917ZR03_9ACTN|nr:hypothetical protein [Wenjunlia tyrosinilytica]GGO87808.1 hypothetical protein GCM10012280_27130 [Wenjunlia tyrosinilytica]